MTANLRGSYMHSKCYDEYKAQKQLMLPSIPKSQLNFSHAPIEDTVRFSSSVPKVLWILLVPTLLDAFQRAAIFHTMSIS